MPTYEYRCAKCGEHLEVYQSFSDAPLKRHKGCGGKLDKVFGSVGIVLKGSGFYRTDNRAGGSRSGRSDRTEGTTSDGGRDGAKTESAGNGKPADSSSSGNGSSKPDGKSTKKSDGASTTGKSA